MSALDVIVVGAGTHGLALAAALGQKGRRVLVLERRDRPGGLAAQSEFHPGFHAPGPVLDDGRVSGATVRDLALENHGLRWRDPPRRLVPGIGWIGRATDHVHPYRELLRRISPVLSRLQEEPSPEVLGQGVRDLASLLLPLWQLRRLGARDMVELLRLLPQSVRDAFDEAGVSSPLAAAFVLPSLAPTWAGPFSPGTLALHFWHECRRDREVVGGGPALVEALLRCVRSHRVEIRTSAEVRRLVWESERVQGVELATGENLRAERVVTTCDPRLLLELLPPFSLPPGLERDLRRWRGRGTQARLNLALSGPLQFEGVGDPVEAAVVSGGLRELERSFEAVKYRRFSDRPALQVRVPTVADQRLAPPGHHVAVIDASFAPPDIEGGWTAEARDVFRGLVVDRLAEHAPTVRDRIVGAQLLVPPDFEEEYRIPGGHLHHGEPALDQLLSLRPSAHCARVREPLPGLTLAGSGTHPGGGLTLVFPRLG